VADDREQWMRRLGPLYPGAVALRQTTAIRWPGELRATADDSQRSAPWMVAMGAALGVAAWVVGWIAGELGVVPALRGALAVIALIALSAALLDVGLARTVERWLARDEDGAPPLGAAGVTALIGTALLRVVAMLAIRPSAWLAALVVAPLIGRWAALLLQRLGDVLEAPAGDRRSLVVGEIGWAQVGIVTGLVALIAVLGLGWSALAVVAAAGAVAFAVGLASERRRGGLDGDALAAAAACCEVLAFLGIAAVAPALLSPWTN
jgi:adenosylcobinamide-GDP ribazoletransferase